MEDLEIREQFAEVRTTHLGRAGLWYGLACVSIITILMVAAFGPRLLHREPPSMWIILPLQLLQLPATFIVARYSRRITNRAKSWDSKMCKHCGYDLREIPEPGPCPECGKAFDLVKLQNYWKHSG